MEVLGFKSYTASWFGVIHLEGRVSWLFKKVVTSLQLSFILELWLFIGLLNDVACRLGLCLLWPLFANKDITLQMRWGSIACVSRTLIDFRHAFEDFLSKRKWYLKPTSVCCMQQATCRISSDVWWQMERATWLWGCEVAVYTSVLAWPNMACQLWRRCQIDFFVGPHLV